MASLPGYLRIVLVEEVFGNAITLRDRIHPGQFVTRYPRHRLKQTEHGSCISLFAKGFDCRSPLTAGDDVGGLRGNQISDCQRLADEVFDPGRKLDHAGRADGQVLKRIIDIDLILTGMPHGEVSELLAAHVLVCADHVHDEELEPEFRGTIIRIPEHHAKVQRVGHPVFDRGDRVFGIEVIHVLLAIPQGLQVRPLLIRAGHDVGRNITGHTVFVDLIILAENPGHSVLTGIIFDAHSDLGNVLTGNLNGLHIDICEGVGEGV